MDRIHEMTLVKEDLRNLDWEEKFFLELSKSEISLMTDQPQMGPDGWPYLLTQTDGEEKEPAQKIIQWAAQKGIGLVINPSKDYPDYVFTYGMLWNFRETGRFLAAQVPLPSSLSKLEIGKGEIFKGQPTEAFLPPYVRQVLKDFFRDQNLLQPKILLISQDQKNYDLAFSIESLGNPPEKEHQGILEAISWFLPPHYSLALVSEVQISGFEPL